MKRIVLALILAVLLLPAGAAEAVEVSIPETGEAVKMTGVVKKVEVGKMLLTFQADQDKKNHRVRGAKSILETLKAGDLIIITVTDDSIKYIRKVESIEKGKKKNASSPKASAPTGKPPVAGKSSTPENPPAGTP